MVTSRTMAKAIGDALGIAPQSAELHLKTIRAAGKISFKGYGRAAAAMTGLDASRLLLAAAGSLFAKDSLQVLENFAALRPLRYPRATFTLEGFLAKRLESLVQEQSKEELSASEWHKYRGQRHRRPRPFGSPRLAETALQLIEPMGLSAGNLPRFAIVRWRSHRGHSYVLAFGPYAEINSEQMPSPTISDIYDVINHYEGANFFQIRAVKRDALVSIARSIQE